MAKKTPTKNPPWQRLKKNQKARINFAILGLLIGLSLTAELWCNNKPIFLYHHQRLFFPAYVKYHPSEFGFNNAYQMDYRQLSMNSDDFSIWPIIQWDPYESNSKLASYPSPPTIENMMGTDDRGRDVLTRILYGFRYTFFYAAGVWFFSYLIGTCFGAIAGYFGGTFDILGMRLIEIFDSMPSLLLLLTLISVFSPSLFLLICFSVFFGWTSIATYVRAEFLSLRQRDFVLGAHAIGANHLRIIVIHMLPNALTPILTFSPFAIAANILTLTNMDYLGLGLPVPTPSWGELLSQAQKYITIAEWLVWWPSGFLVLTLVVLINIGLTIRDAFDTRSSP